MAIDRAPIPIEWFEFIRPELVGQWLIKKLLPAGGLIMAYGHPGSGKSFMALDMALHIALGRDWFGRKVRPGAVAYVAAEGQSGLRQRIEAFRHERLEPEQASVPLALIPCQVDLLKPDADTGPLIEQLSLAARERGAPFALVVIDTLSRTFGGGDENGSEMAAYVRNLGRIQAALGSAVMVVHHRPKSSENETPRGHGSLQGACDTILLIEASGPVKRLRVTKQKDADAGPEISFRLRSVVIGNDEDGEPVTSCVVEAADIGEFGSGANGKCKLSNQARIALNALHHAIADHGTEAPAGIPANKLPPGILSRVATLERWQQSFEAMAGSDKKPDSLRRDFQRQRDALQSAEYVTIWGDVAWPS